ncbi:MAG: C40 family peptidase [Endomicrobium sp.]|nr:C40 family peptidase [Endomicrobium sp.]
MLKLLNEQKQKITSIARAFAEAELPYVYGAEVKLNTPPEKILATRTAFDCSEFIEYLFYQAARIKVPDGAKYQYEWSSRNKIEDKSAEVGDIVFKQKNGEINHVAIVIEVSGQTILIAEFEGFYKKAIIRPLSAFRNVKPAASQPVEGIFRF